MNVLTYNRFFKRFFARFIFNAIFQNPAKIITSGIKHVVNVKTTIYEAYETKE